MGDCILRSSAAGGKENSMYFDAIEYGKRIAELRKQKGLKQEEVAEGLNISLVYLRMLEHGKRIGSFDLLYDISEYFGVSTDFLVKGKDSNHSNERERLKAMAAELIELSQRY